MTPKILQTIITATDRFSAPVSKMGRHAEATFAKVERSLRRTSQQYEHMAFQALKMGTAILAPMGLAVNEAVKFEDALTDITKTSNLKGAELERYADSLLKMSTGTRTSIEELTRISVIGGQMGVAKDELLGFAEAANVFSVALGDEFSGGTEQAISSVAKMVKLFDKTKNLPIGDAIMKTGSVINNLGATSNATSENISKFILRVGGMPKALRPAITDVAALGSVLESSGVNYERGSSGFINLVSRAGRKIGDFGRLMGMTKNKAADLLNTNPLEFVKKFSEAFKGMRAEKMEQILQKLNVNTLETKAVVGVLSESTKDLTKAQAAQNTVFEKGSDVMNEYNTKNNSTAANIEKMKNRISRLVIVASKQFLPIINQVIDDLAPVIERFTEWANKNQKLVGGLMKFAAGAGVVILALGALSMAVSVLSSAIAFLIGPVGAIITALGFLAVSVYAVTTNMGDLTVAQKALDNVNNRAMRSSIAQRVEVKRLFEQLRINEEGSNRYKLALTELEKVSSGVIKKHQLHVKSLAQIDEAEKSLTRTIISEARKRASERILIEKYYEMQNLKDNGDKPAFFLQHLFSKIEDVRVSDKTAKLKEEIAAIEANMLKMDSEEDDRPKKISKDENWVNSLDMLGKGMKETLTIIFENMPEGLSVKRKGFNNSGGPSVDLTDRIIFND